MERGDGLRFAADAVAGRCSNTRRMSGVSRIGGLKFFRVGGLDDQAYDFAGSKLEIGWQGDFHWESDLWSCCWMQGRIRDEFKL